MSHYQVDVDRISEASRLVANSVGIVRGEVAAMLSHLTCLESIWTGGASSAFACLVDQWRGAQAQLEQALDTISTGLANAAAEYETAEGAATRMFMR
jgi:WXG100 family type VII secretion target